jgi:hypothetical protein
MLPRPPAARIAAALGAAAALVAQLRDRIGRSKTADRDEIAGMNARMLRDIGAELALRAPTVTRDFDHTRL